MEPFVIFRYVNLPILCCMPSRDLILVIIDQSRKLNDEWGTNFMIDKIFAS